MAEVGMVDDMPVLRGEKLIEYIQRTLIVREHLNYRGSDRHSDEYIFAQTLAYFGRFGAPTVVSVSTPQLGAFWLHTGRRALIVLAQRREEDFRQGVMLLGYHLLMQLQPLPSVPTICAPFESALWRAPAFFWPRFFYHCLAVDSAEQQLRQPA